jgi:hypothetical protein
VATITRLASDPPRRARPPARDESFDRDETY